MAYGTAVSGIVIHVNKIHKNHSQILTIANVQITLTLTWTQPELSLNLA